MKIGDGQVLDKLNRAFESCGIFTGEPGNHIDADGKIGDRPDELFQQVLEIRGRVVPLHEGKNRVVAALKRNVQVRAEKS
ncbi:MAG: hypothetical protein A4E66_02603 [Syntrophus sp. PtaB.Bin001]|nr:MAG: hypothetical protein A4E66_02603 [Syntrophus sp. PtaB.Bin001]